MRAAIKKVSITLIILSVILVVRIFLFDIYKVSSNSMTPTLFPGDFILIDKFEYRPRVINVFKLVFSNEVEYIWFKGLEKIEKNDIIVFNIPQYKNLSFTNNFIFGTRLIKRCFGLPGDTVLIRNITTPAYINMGDIELFPNDKSLKWDLGNFGPLYVPRKGDTLHLTKKNVDYYHDILLYENNKLEIRNDSVFSEDTHLKEIVFNFNYYFMLGDNFYLSNDSRMWGFLPETHIIGKTKMVLISFDAEKPWFRKFSWKRFFLKLK